MNSLKSLGMKKVRGVLASEKDVKKTRISLEKKTEKIFREFARSRQNVEELAHQRYLD